MLVNRVFSFCIITLSLKLLCTPLKQKLCDKCLCVISLKPSKKLNNNCKFLEYSYAGWMLSVGWHAS